MLVSPSEATGVADAMVKAELYISFVLLKACQFIGYWAKESAT